MFKQAYKYSFLVRIVSRFKKDLSYGMSTSEKQVSRFSAVIFILFTYVHSKSTAYLNRHLKVKHSLKKQEMYSHLDTGQI